MIIDSVGSQVKKHRVDMIIESFIIHKVKICFGCYVSRIFDIELD